MTKKKAASRAKKSPTPQKKSKPKTARAAQAVLDLSPVKALEIALFAIERQLHGSNALLEKITAVLLEAGLLLRDIRKAAEEDEAERKKQLQLFAEKAAAEAPQAPAKKRGRKPKAETVLHGDTGAGLNGRGYTPETPPLVDREPVAQSTPAPAPITEAAPATTPQAASAPVQGAVDKAVMISYLEKVHESRGMEAARELISRVGARRVGEILPEHYGQVVELCKAAIQ